ncbi:hypothetical protein [Nocardioides speluncae]|uniref:hypothetical protein n=1 Tax=Nocardioides speluncae TaxID=2670337 RepID=UPI000D692923|nr:hypothetical protein [Nocardioides speluncae]
MTDELRVTLDGAHGEISAKAFHRTLGGTLELVKAAGDALGTSAGQWTVAELRVGSATVVIANPAALGVTTLIASGLESLANSPAVPTRWTQDMVQRVRTIGRVVGSHGVRGISVGPADSTLLPVDSAVTTNAEAALAAKEVALGRVTGKVDIWKERKGREVGLTLDDGSTMAALYPAHLAERVRHEAVGERVELWGEIERNGAGQRLRIRIDDFTVVPATIPTPVSTIVGLYADLGAQGVTVEDFLRERE